MNISTQANKTIKLQKISQNEAINTVDAQKIFQGKKKVTLSHHGDNYLLQITSNNKLLLTK